MIKYFCDLCGKEFREPGRIIPLYVGRYNKVQPECELCSECWPVLVEQVQAFVYNTVWQGKENKT